MRRKHPVLLTDVDDTLADLRSVQNEITEALFGKLMTRAEVEELSKPDRRKFFDELAARRPARTLKPFEGAVETILWARDQGWDVYFVTSYLTSCPTWTYDRDQWCRRTFGEWGFRRAVHTPHKFLCQGDVLIDDLPEKVNEWRRWNDGHAILMGSLENNFGVGTVGAGVRVVRDWASIRRFLEGLG